MSKARQARRKAAKKKNAQPLSIWITPALRTRLRKRAKVEGRTLSAIARRAVEVYAATPIPEKSPALEPATAAEALS